MNAQRAHRLATAYLLVQALAGAAWWIAMFVNPSWRGWFFAPDSSGTLLWSLLAADVLLFVGGSLLASILIATHNRFARTALAFVTGAVWYAGLFAIGQAVAAPQTWLGAAMMLPCMAATLVCLISASRRGNGAP